MSKQILFIQGGGEDGYHADAALVASLQEAVGKEYDIYYPELKSDESAADFGWLQQIGKMLSASDDGVILVAHSLGASMLLKYLSENSVHKKIAGIFLIAVPFWEGDEEWKEGLKLKEGVANTLPNGVPIFFYHCRDDKEVPFSHLEKYKKEITKAAFREFDNGGHQFNNDLTSVAEDIQSL